MRSIVASCFALFLMGCHVPGIAPPGALTAGDLLAAVKPRAVDITAGHWLDIDVTITNTSDHKIELCTGSGKSVHLWGIDAKYTKSLSYSVVDHPSCQSRFTLHPGESRQWNDHLQIPPVPSGRAKLILAFQIVDPNRCRQSYGCDDFWLPATFEPLVVR